MDKEKVFTDFLALTNECGKLSTFDQIFKYPKIMVDFFESIWQDGYDKGHKAGEVFKETKQSKLN